MKRLATYCVDHRRIVLVAWIAILVITGFAAGSVGAKYSEDFQLPDSDSTRAIDVLKDRFPAQSGDSAQIVYQADSGVKSFQSQIEASLAKICTPEAPPKQGCKSGIAHVSGVVSPFDAANQVSKDGKIAFASLSFDEFANDIPVGDLKDVITAADKAAGDGLTVAEGGQPIETVRFNEQQGGSSELISLIGAIVILLIVFGSVVAMGLPILTAVISLGTALSVITLATHIFSVVDFATQLATLIGLGVGIDYALFLMTRYRAGLGEGLEPREAVIQAVDTAGRAVLFAGITVVIAVLGMILMGVSFLYGPAVASSVAVLLTMTAALTLLPAMLSKVGNRIDSWRLPGMKPKPRVENPDGRWMRWSRFIERRPWVTGLSALAVLVVLTIPVFSLDLGSADAGTDPSDSTTRQAYDLLAEGFGPGFNGPLQVVAEVPDGTSDTDLEADLQKLSAGLAADSDVAGVEPPVLAPKGGAAVINVFPKTSPQDQKTEALVKRIRADIAAPVEESGVTVHVGGTTAIFSDFASVLTDKLPLFIGVVVLLSAILLTAVFRSVLVPLKAVVMNLLSIGASFGIVVAIFQKGWGASLVGVDSKAPIEAFLPVMVFAIVFGLSMDYEVFLMSRIHEEWEKRKDASEAVARGLAATGRVITAAASIMIFVFGSFALGDDRVIKLFGIGLASAVLIDAVLIRTILVPSIMVLLQKRAWWIPGWLDRILPMLNVEPPESSSGDSTVGHSP
ncbi:MMPL family transporter [soil metagenome]